MTHGPQPTVRVWDAPTRAFHWLTVLSFGGAYLTADSERWRLIHVTLGYTLGGLLIFRLIWGVVGTRYARFGDFLRSPLAIARYVRSLLRGHPPRHLGHNPAGGVAIALMLFTGACLVATGWATYNDVGGNQMPDWHALAGNVLLWLVLLHLLGVLSASLQHRENLPRAMVTGHNAAEPGAAESAGIHRTWNGLALLMVALVVAFWLYLWFASP